MKSNHKRIGDFIELVDERNKDLSVTKLLGLSITKKFIPSVANTIGTNMANYKIIKKNQFACSVMQVRRDKKMPVALLRDFDEAIISQAYPVFEVFNEAELLPDYLMMWFSRFEFDRHACFLAVGGVRGSLEWDDFIDMELPVPSIEKQRAIVKEYNTIVNRIKLNEKLNQKLEETAQALYKHWFVDFEFPNENGQPYKSSGGKMIYDEQLDKDIPEKFSVRLLGDISNLIDNRGKTPKHTKFVTEFPLIEIGSLKSHTRLIDLSKCVKFVDESTYSNDFRTGHPTKKDILFSTVGSLAELKIIANENCSIAQNIVAFRCNENIGNFVYQQLKDSLNRILQYNIGSVQASIKVSQIVHLPLLIPENNELFIFENIIEKITNHIAVNTNKNFLLEKLKENILSKMSKVESLKTKQVS
jgi:type I restriction enzyme, S subunit